jgi:hypothetical protein
MVTGKNEFEEKIKMVTSLANNEMTPPNKKCVAANPENLHYCIIGEYLVKYISTPFFISESLYDWWQI